jgi:protein arginine N-methyltransferase 1
MILDRQRFEAYAEALRRTITPASVVLDIGAGTGIMSLLACRFGARRVYALEPSDVVQLLIEAARDNGYADRIVAQRKMSTEVTLPERADVIVSDIRGVLPPFQSHLADIADARKRFLAPGGHLLPQTDTMWVAVASVPETFREARAAWTSEPYGLDLRATLPFVDNSLAKQQAQADQMLCQPVQWARLHYPTLNEVQVRGQGTCHISRSAPAHGLLVWFDTEILPGLGYSNAPGARQGIYGQMLFPWSQAAHLQAGDTVAFELRADSIGSQVFWTWTTEIRRPGASAPLLERTRQSTFRGQPRSGDWLRRRAPEFAPALSQRGELTLQVLAGMRAGRTIGELARELHAAHPERFATLDSAHGFVGDVSGLYGD